MKKHSNKHCTMDSLSWLSQCAVVRAMQCIWYCSRFWNLCCGLWYVARYCFPWRKSLATILSSMSSQCNHTLCYCKLCTFLYCLWILWVKVLVCMFWILLGLPILNFHTLQWAINFYFSINIFEFFLLSNQIDCNYVKRGIGNLNSLK